MKKTVLFLILILFINCNKSQINGIKIGSALVNAQSYAENQTLITLIKGTLKLDKDSLKALLYTSCDGEGGYDLGSVIAQIIDTVGEHNFLEMIKSLTADEKSLLKSFIEVGLEYGYPVNGKSKNETVDKEFPEIYDQLFRKPNQYP